MAWLRAYSEKHRIQIGDLYSVMKLDLTLIITIVTVLTYTKPYQLQTVLFKVLGLRC